MDTANLQAQLNAFALNDNVYPTGGITLTPGIYYLNATLVVPQSYGWRLWGSGTWNTVIHMVTPNTPIFTFSTSFMGWWESATCPPLCDQPDACRESLVDRLLFHRRRRQRHLQLDRPSLLFQQLHPRCLNSSFGRGTARGVGLYGRTLLVLELHGRSGGVARESADRTALVRVARLLCELRHLGRRNGGISHRTRLHHQSIESLV